MKLTTHHLLPLLSDLLICCLSISYLRHILILSQSPAQFSEVQIIWLAKPVQAKDG